MALPYILLTILRGSIIIAAKKISRRKEQEAVKNKAFLAISSLLLILNISLVVPFSIMVKQQKPVNMTLILAIAMAAYTTYKVVMASVNLKKRRVSSDVLVWLLRTISFIDALVSILTLQNTRIMVNSNDEKMTMLPLTAFTSAAVWAVVLFLSVNAIVKGIKRVKKGSGRSRVERRKTGCCAFLLDKCTAIAV
jgi:cation transport ATPase